MQKMCKKNDATLQNLTYLINIWEILQIQHVVSHCLLHKANANKIRHIICKSNSHLLSLHFQKN